MQRFPSIVQSYAGQNQQQTINVPAPIAYKYIDREEGCWAMMPYSFLYPQAPDIGTQFLPPPIGKTDLWRAQGTWPL